MLKDFWAFIALVVLLAVGALVVTGTEIAAVMSGNMELIDTIYHFDSAIIKMPDGSVVSGKVEQWSDHSDADSVQITIDGKVYLTHYENAVLIAE